jgi:hypothetical protein
MDCDVQCRTSGEMALRMAQPNQTDEAVIIEGILAWNSELFHDLIRPHEQSVYRNGALDLRSRCEGGQLGRLHW